MNATTSTAVEPDAKLRLSQAARIVPGKPHPTCLWRWARHGVLARTGERVRLRHIRIGSRVFTSAAWLDEFFSALAAADAAYFDAKPPRDRASATTTVKPATARQRERDIARGTAAGRGGNLTTQPAAGREK